MNESGKAPIGAEDQSTFPGLHTADIVFAVVDKAILFCAIFSGIVLLGLMALTSYEVFLRYILKQGVDWFLEIAGYLCVIAVFLGNAYTFQVGGHVSIDFFVINQPESRRGVLKLVKYCLCLLFFVIMSSSSFQVALQSFRVNKCSNTLLSIPIGPFELFVFIGWVLIAFQSLSLIYKQIVTIRSSGDDRDQQARVIPKGK